MILEDPVTRLRRLLDAATPGPWTRRGDQSLHMDGSSGAYFICSDDLVGRSIQSSVAVIGRRSGRPDAKLIVESRNLLPLLLDLVDSARIATAEANYQSTMILKSSIAALRHSLARLDAAE